MGNGKRHGLVWVMVFVLVFSMGYGICVSICSGKNTVKILVASLQIRSGTGVTWGFSWNCSESILQFYVHSPVQVPYSPLEKSLD